MCMYFFVHAFVHDAFMFRLAPTIHCILTSVYHNVQGLVISHMCCHRGVCGQKVNENLLVDFVSVNIVKLE